VVWSSVEVINNWDFEPDLQESVGLWLMVIQSVIIKAILPLFAVQSDYRVDFKQDFVLLCF